jgi:hypothetical protein
MSSADRDLDTGVSDPEKQAGLTQDPARHSTKPPKEGSDRGEDPRGQRRANISETISTDAADASSANPPSANRNRPDDGKLGESGRKPEQPT